MMDQKEIPLFFIPGLGTDSRIFQNLAAAGLQFFVIEWKQPKKDEDFDAYLKRMAADLPDGKFNLAGVSFGGMVAQSIAEFKSPESLILITTIRHPSEYPWWIRMLIKLPLGPLLNGRLLKILAKLALPIRSKAKLPDGQRASGIIDFADPYLVEWSVRMAMNWKGGN